jgi:hypothetical protein
MVATNEELLTEVKKLQKLHFYLKTAEGEAADTIVTQLREYEGGYILFLANTDRQRSKTLSTVFSVAGSVTEYDLFSGTTQQVSVASNGTKDIEWKVDFSPAGARLFVINPNEKPQREMKKDVAVLGENRRVFFKDTTKITLDRLNVLVLDSCQFALSKAPLSPKGVFIWEAQRVIRDRLSMVQVDTDEIEQRYVWAGIPHPNDGTQLELLYSFEVEALPENPCFLCLEESSRFAICLNGSEIDSACVDCYMDESLEMIALPGLKLGINILKIETKYCNDMSLGSIYVLGDFGVSPSRKIVKKVTELSLGDWSGQGLFHYPGNVTYHYEFFLSDVVGKALLSLDQWKGLCVEIQCNEMVFDVPWKGFLPLDVTGCLKKGHNLLSITIFGSPRNMFGPLHLKGGSPLFTNPESFSPKAENLSLSYNVVAAGLFSVPQLEIFN